MDDKHEIPIYGDFKSNKSDQERYLELTDDYMEKAFRVRDWDEDQERESILRKFPQGTLERRKAETTFGRLVELKAQQERLEHWEFFLRRDLKLPNRGAKKKEENLIKTDVATVRINLEERVKEAEASGESAESPITFSLFIVKCMVDLLNTKKYSETEEQDE